MRQIWLVCLLIEEDSLACCLRENIFLWKPDNFHDERQLLLLALAREDGNTSKQLGQNAAEAPHINCGGVRYAQNNFRGSVEPRLDVGIDPLIGEAARTKVYDLDA